MVRRRASQASRSAVSGLIGPAPSSSGGASSLRCTIRVVGLRLGPPSVPPLSSEADECIGGVLLPLEGGAGLFVECALGLGDVPDGLLEGCALLQRQAPAEHQLASPACPGHAQRATLIQRLVVRHRGRGERARSQRDRAGRFAERHARQLRIALGSRELRGGCNLIEVQRAGAERVIERRQVAQRSAGVRDAHRGAVVAARDLRQPLRAGGAAGGLPVTLVVGLTHDLRQPLGQTRLLLTDHPHLATTRLAPPLQHLIDRPLQCGEHMFASYQPHHPANVPRLCRNPAL